MKKPVFKTNNIPPKDIQNAIWGGAFDWEDFDKVRPDVYDCWMRIAYILSNEENMGRTKEIISKMDFSEYE